VITIAAQSKKPAQRASTMNSVREDEYIVRGIDMRCIDVFFAAPVIDS
jgi:hypothetical protein